MTKQLVTAMAIQMEVTETVVTEMAWLAAAAALTRRESKQCSWLEKVSMHVDAKDRDTETHLCRLGHPSDPQTARTETLNVDGDLDASNLKL